MGLVGLLVHLRVDGKESGTAFRSSFGEAAVSKLHCGVVGMSVEMKDW